MYNTADRQDGYGHYADYPHCQDCGDILEPREYMAGLCARCQYDNWEPYTEEEMEDAR